MAVITPTNPTTPSNPGGGVYTPGNQGAYNNTSAYGNFLRPFAANSLWNSKPVAPVFTTVGIPTNEYYPSIGPGKFSTGAFEALATDPEVTIYKHNYYGFIRDTDAEEDKASITIPRWPASAVPATGGDGHCEIVDTVTGIVHSFWQLSKDADGKWTAATYNWTKIDGLGWGDPAHYFQGARAAAVAPIGGLIRKHEAFDGKSMYNHALAMSLAFNGLSPNPTYVFPATSADTNAAYLNSGAIPEGALVMLPPTFDVSKLKNEGLRKVANTLKTFGAYIVDQNIGTPFAIYVENGTDYNLHRGGWNQANADELQTIRAALRMVNATNFIGGDGKAVIRDPNPNLLSMRGKWPLSGKTGPERPVYNTWTQRLEFPATANYIEVVDGNGRGVTKVTWAKIQVGDKLRLTSVTTEGGKFGVQLWVGSNCVLNTKMMDNGQYHDFEMVAGMWFVFYARSAGGFKASTVSATLTKR